MTRKINGFAYFPIINGKQRDILPDTKFLIDVECMFAVLPGSDFIAYLEAQNDAMDIFPEIKLYVN